MINKFFQNIFGREHINFRCIKRDSRPIDYNGYYDETANKTLSQINEQGYEVYFVVNNGGYKDADIKKINAVFIDLDCGRDQERMYFPPDVVQRYKDEKLQVIRNWEYKPSYVVETRNGLHVYWLVNGSPNIEDFREAMSRLINYFGGDQAVKTPARLMRVPGYYWCKDPSNKHLTTIIEYSSHRYPIKDLLMSLPETSGGDKGTLNKKKYNITLYRGYPKPPFSGSDNTPLIANRDITQLHALIQPPGIKLSSHEQVYDYLKKQDLVQFLGTNGRSFPCLFHSDNNPSAGIVQNTETGHYLYNCFSTNCGFKGTIIQCTEKILRCNRVEALRFLRKVYNVEYHETEWQQCQKEILAENQRFLLSPEFAECYPELYSLVKNYLHILYLIIGIASDHILTENFTNAQGQAVFFSSRRYLSSLFQKDPKKTGQRLGLFSYLGLVNKVSLDTLPEFLLKRAKHEAAKKKQKKLVSFYSIPSYDTNTLEFSTMKAKEYRNKGFTMKGWSRELILRSLGQEEANRVFPQMKGELTPSTHEFLHEGIEAVLVRFLDQKGWSTEKEIKEFFYNNSIFCKPFIDKQVKRTIPELLSRLGLIKIRSTKSLKETYGIAQSGYPFLILKQ